MVVVEAAGDVGAHNANLCEKMGSGGVGGHNCTLKTIRVQES